MLLAATAVVGFSILGFAPNYLDLQRSTDAAHFAELVEEYGELRSSVAAGLDLAFAVLYTLTVVAFVGERRVYRFGVGLVAAGAVFDEVENVFVLVGTLDPAGVSDGAVDWMKRFGDLKAAALILGVVLLLGTLLRGPIRGRESTL